jgi:hypothetical protein
MIKANELNEWADHILPVLVDTNITATNLRIISAERKNGLHIITHGFFQNMWFQQRFILMIQLAKIFSNSKNQKSNFIKLCNRLENEPFDDEIKKLLSENQLKLTDVFRSREDVLAAIGFFRNNLLRHQAAIDNLIDLRDKVFAHTDKVASKPKISHDELQDLNLLASEMYNTLFGKIFDRHFFFRTEDWDLRYIIKQLSTKTISQPPIKND